MVMSRQSHTFTTKTAHGPISLHWLLYVLFTLYELLVFSPVMQFQNKYGLNIRMKMLLLPSADLISKLTFWFQLFAKLISRQQNSLLAR